MNRQSARKKHRSFLLILWWSLPFTALMMTASSLQPAATPAVVHTRMRSSRRRFLNAAGLVSAAACCLAGLSPAPANALALQQPQQQQQPARTFPQAQQPTTTTVAYQQLSLNMQRDYGVTVPVAAWFPLRQPTDDQEEGSVVTTLKPATYRHRISVRRIGQLLARWDFIPEFAARNYDMAPGGGCASTVRVVDGGSSAPPGGGLGLPVTEAPVVLLAHGFLGSRFDLSHLAEELAAHGFVCLAPEYPESLAASYDRGVGAKNTKPPPGGGGLAALDRRAINDALLDSLTQEWNIRASAHGIVGHSLGCGTVAQTGDDRWARVSIAGFPPANADDATPGLLLTSMNDGAVSMARRGDFRSLLARANYELLDETALPTKTTAQLPRRAALVFDRPDAPNHISFLAESVNDAMIELLSPLLPVAQTMGIPVLDFDRYQISRDSRATAAVVLPLVVQYLKQEMTTSEER